MLKYDASYIIVYVFTKYNGIYINYEKIKNRCKKNINIIKLLSL